MRVSYLLNHTGHTTLMCQRPGGSLQRLRQQHSQRCVLFLPFAHLFSFKENLSIHPIWKVIWTSVVETKGRPNIAWQQLSGILFFSVCTKVEHSSKPKENLDDPDKLCKGEVEQIRAEMSVSAGGGRSKKPRLPLTT